MSGSESIKGFDYQICCSLKLILDLYETDYSNVSIKFESLDESEEDFNIISESSKVFYQIKKRAEGYHWTPSLMKPIFGNFLESNDDSTQYFFITDGTLSTDVKKLRNKINSNEYLDNEILSAFLPSDNSYSNLREVLKKTTILSRYYSSDDDDPSKNLKIEIIKLLSGASFSVTDDVSTVYSGVWKIIFDYSKASSSVDFSDLVAVFKKSGLHRKIKEWKNVPENLNYFERKNQFLRLTAAINDHAFTVVNGINGSGKTWTTANYFHKNNIVPCWISIDYFTSFDFFSEQLTSYLVENGFDDHADKLSDLKFSERLEAILSILNDLDVYIVLDSLNSSNSSFFEFVSNLISYSGNCCLKGKVIVTSTIRISSKHFSPLNSNLIEINVDNLSLLETRKILNVPDVLPINFNVMDFYESIGGHPLSVFTFKSSVINNNGKIEYIKGIMEHARNESIRYIVNKSIQLLSDKNRGILQTLSVIEGRITQGEIRKLLSSKVKPEYLFSEMISYNLISLSGEYVVIHDSIRQAALDMLTIHEKYKLHRNLEQYYFSLIDKSFDPEEGVSKELTSHWGFHLEKLKNSDYIEEKYRLILGLESDHISSLSDIWQYSYPMDYTSEDLSDSNAIVSNLLEKKLIREVYYYRPLQWWRNLRYREFFPRKYGTINLDVWQKILILYLCESRGLSASMGYIPVMKYNYSWVAQSLICQWEHCIELMHFPPDEDEANNSTDAESEGCPLFGHCCPGGVKQATECRSLGGGFNDE